MPHPSSTRSSRLHLALATVLALATIPVFAADVSFKITDQKNAPVVDAVVALYPLDAPLPAIVATEPPEIEQRNTQFHPFLTVVRVGTSVRLPNRETKLAHHVYSLSPTKQFEFPLYEPGKAETILFDKPGVVALGCNIHAAMLAYVVVLDAPWFTQTSAAGTATITSVPPGRYRAEVWHWRFKEPKDPVLREIVVSETEAPVPHGFALVLNPDRRPSRLPESNRGGYK